MKKHFPPPRQFYALAYLCVCLNAGVLKYYELTDKPTFTRLIAEDSLIESLTAVLLLSAGILLFVTGRMERKALRRWIYVLGGIVVLFIAGEEISWGQRIFGYPTPDWISERNYQREFTVHNLYVLGASLEHGFRYGVHLLCLMACMAFFTGRERIRGIPVPSILLTLSLLTTHSYTAEGLHSDLIPVALGALSGPQNTLICLIIIFALFCRQYELLIFSAAAILLSLALVVVNHLEIFLSKGSRYEVFEYLVTLGILCYSFELFLNQRPFRQADLVVRRSKPDQGRDSLGPLFQRLARPVGSRLVRVLAPPAAREFRPVWPAIPALSIAMSIGLLSTAYVGFWSRETAIRNLDQEISSREPMIRSHFDVYLSQNRILYYKDRCSRSDVLPPFFLYVIPTDPNESLLIRLFTFFEYGTALYRNAAYRDRNRDGYNVKSSCFLAYPLPRGEIATIWTGQESRWEAAAPAYRQAQDGDGPADRFERDRSRAMIHASRRLYDAVVSREPRVRSDFDVSLHDGGLTFVKEPCTRADVEAGFYLHVVPVDNASLPYWRQEHRFDNLDFRFSNFGGVFDDKCLAVVPLPAYEMSSIRTGQYTSEKRLWQVELPAHTVGTGESNM